jgi:hypothetical protein
MPTPAGLTASGGLPRARGMLRNGIEAAACGRGGRGDMAWDLLLEADHYLPRCCALFLPAASDLTRVSAP